MSRTACKEIIFSLPDVDLTNCDGNFISLYDVLLTFAGFQTNTPSLYPAPDLPSGWSQTIRVSVMLHGMSFADQALTNGGMVLSFGPEGTNVLTCTCGLNNLIFC